MVVIGKGIVELMIKMKWDCYVLVFEFVWCRFYVELFIDLNVLVFFGCKGGFLFFGEYCWVFDNVGD